jgi:uncharacterized protein
VDGLTQQLMKYEWSEDKRQTNIGRHGKDFADAHKIWESGATPVNEYSERKGEERWKTTGKIEKEVCVVVFEDKGDTRRIISFRSANNAERKTYERERGRETGAEDSLTRLLEYTEREREGRRADKIDRVEQQKPLKEHKDREEYER